MINAEALQALALANTHGEDTDKTLERAKKYMKFITGKPSDKSSASVSSSSVVNAKKEDGGLVPVQLSAPSFDEVQNAGFKLMNERGYEALREVLNEFKVTTVKDIPENQYGNVIKILREKLVEGDGLI